MARTEKLWAVAGPVAGDGTVPADHPSRALVGRILDDRFTILDVLATGGMGVLYEASDAVLERPVVVKVLGVATANDRGAGQRLIREARIACRVEHPAIVTVFHLGLLETNEPYLVLERLAGLDLDELLHTNGPLTPVQVAAVLEPIADALDALHQEGVVHRDVKPSNVFVLGGRLFRPRVKLIDFGLALLDTAASERLTRMGRVLGTPEYIAPECATGTRAGPPADVYALASTAFELLVGRPPFSGAAMDVLIAKTRTEPPQLRDHVDAASLGELGGWIMRGLSRRPEDRPTASELARAFAVAARREEGDERHVPRTSDLVELGARSPTRDLRTPQLGQLPSIELPPVPRAPTPATPPAAMPVVPEPAPAPAPVAVNEQPMRVAWAALGVAALALLTALVALMTR
jgi:serine/threonine protein kinase